MTNAAQSMVMTAKQERDVEAALLAYWTSRDEAKLAQEERGVIDVGGRAGVTSGSHLDRVAQLLGRVCLRAGVPPKQVFYKAPKGDPMKRKKVASGFTLPGFYRPTKQWDLVVYHEKVPIVIVELKSQNGPSYGNNANNRAEEALGNAMDLRRAREAGFIPGEPWTGYAYVIEDDLASREIRGSRDKGRIARSADFDGWSYISRVQHLCQRLAAENLYDATWAVATSRPSCPATKAKPNRCPQIKSAVTPHTHEFDWRELDDAESGYVGFVNGLTAQLAKYYEGVKTDDPAVTGLL